MSEEKTSNTRLITFEDWTLRVRVPTEKPARVLLMLHGWTGDENSMWSFARNLPASYWLLAPRAPYVAAQGGFSWRAPVAGGWPTIEAMRPATAMLYDLIERWGIANAVDTSVVDVIGFSQGGAMTVSLALHHPGHVRKMGVLAGFAPLGAEEFIPYRPLENKKVFWAHGTQDEMVPVGLARASMKVLEDCGASVDYCEAEVGHKVSADCLRALEAYLAE